MAGEDKNVNPEGNENPEPEGQEDKTFNEDYVKELREEAKKYRLKLRETEDAKKKLEDEKLTDTEKEKQRLKELETENESYKSKLKSLEVSSMIVRSASGKGFVDLETVELLAQKELSSEEEVSQKDVDKIIDKLAKDKPYLLNSGDNTATPGKGNSEKKNLEGGKDLDKIWADMLRGK